MKMLPPVVHIRSATEQTALRWSVERMREELRADQPGGYLVAQDLAHMMLIQALRLHLAEHLDGSPGWFADLADENIGAALVATHAEPARRWSLQSLGYHVGMSRSTFAQRFKQVAGATAMEYVTRWRMLLAVERLEHAGDPISIIAPSLGYESESAFSTPFKRVMGCAPRQIWPSFGKVERYDNDNIRRASGSRRPVKASQSALTFRRGCCHHDY